MILTNQPSNLHKWRVQSNINISHWFFPIILKSIEDKFTSQFKVKQSIALDNKQLYSNRQLIRIFLSNISLIFRLVGKYHRQIYISYNNLEIVIYSSILPLNAHKWTLLSCTFQSRSKGQDTWNNIYRHKHYHELNVQSLNIDCSTMIGVFWFKAYLEMDMDQR